MEQRLNHLTTPPILAEADQNFLQDLKRDFPALFTESYQRKFPLPKITPLQS